MKEFKLARSTKIDGLTCKGAEKIITALKIAADYQRSTLATLDSSYKIMADNSDDSYVYEESQLCISSTMRERLNISILHIIATMKIRSGMMYSMTIL